MDQKPLALHDNRPFFERALQYGVTSGIITRERIDEILESGPKGMVQIAHTFGTEYLRPDLLEARNRVVNLVSLYLENASEGDLEKAAKLLSDHTFLSHSKGGSDMVKFIHHLPETPLLGMDDTSDALEESYDRYAPGKQMAYGLLSKYRYDRYTRMKNENMVRICEWFMKKFPYLHEDDFSGYNSEGVFATLLLFSIDGFNLQSLPTKQKIIDTIQKNRGRKILWDTVLEGAPVVYIPYIKNTIAVLEKIFGKASLEDSDIWLFESHEYDINWMDVHETLIHEQWERLTEGKILTRQEKQTLLFSFLAGGEPRTSITEKEAKALIGYLVEHTPEYTEVIEDFIEQNIPHEYHENIRQQWVSLAKEMGTLYEKDVPLSTKLWILREAGCNFTKGRKKTPKKVTTGVK